MMSKAVFIFMLLSVQALSGLERAMHYETAAMTGLRAAELRALKVGDFDFMANVVRLAGEYTKNRKDAIIPLKPDFAVRLKTFFAGRLPDCHAFKTAASAHEVRVLRADLKAAGIPEKDESGRVFDFHSFRVFFASMLAAAGTNPKTAMELLRHSDIRLTMNTYSHAYRESLTAAVDTLPNLDTSNLENAKMTGTDDQAAEVLPLIAEEIRDEAKNYDHSLVYENSLKEIESVCSGQIEDSRNALKIGFQDKKSGFQVQECIPLKSAQKWRRGDSNPCPETFQAGPLRA